METPATAPIRWGCVVSVPSNLATSNILYYILLSFFFFFRYCNCFSLCPIYGTPFLLHSHSDTQQSWHPNCSFFLLFLACSLLLVASYGQGGEWATLLPVIGSLLPIVYLQLWRLYTWCFCIFLSLFWSKSQIVPSILFCFIHFLYILKLFQIYQSVKFSIKKNFMTVKYLHI